MTGCIWKHTHNTQVWLSQESNDVCDKVRYQAQAKFNINTHHRLMHKTANVGIYIDIIHRAANVGMYIHRYNAQGCLCGYIDIMHKTAYVGTCIYIDIIHRAAYVGTYIDMHKVRYNYI